MQYPAELLPKKEYKLDIQFPPDVDLNSLSLIRRSLKRKDETTNELGTVRTDAFLEPGKEHLFYSLSCNLCGIFCGEHIYFILEKNEGRKYWKSKENIPKLEEIQFTIDENTCPIYLVVGTIHDQPHTYEKGPADKIQRFEGKCVVVHKPIEANYWHFEINVIEPTSSETIPASEKDWKKKAVVFFFESFLKNHLSVESVECHLSEGLYLE